MTTANECLDVCFTFDTTGSMYPCLTQLRRYISETVSQLFNDIPDLRIAIIAHGDYCDKNRPYVTKILDFSKDAKEVSKFVNTVERTGGGDAPECYELVLYEARTELNWQSGRSKVIVMIGDDVPHSVSYSGNTKNIDWRNELGLLLEGGINVYGVHAMPGIRRHSKSFYEEIAKKTGGFYLTLDQFSSIRDLVMSICYKQDSPEALNKFVAEITVSGRMNKNLAFSIGVMSGEMPEFVEEPSGPLYSSWETSGRRSSRKYAYEADGLVPVPMGRFQVLPVEEDITIQNFIKDQGVEYTKGRGFYELVRHGKKRYKIQGYKEIILMDRESGDFFNGSDVRRILGLKPWKSKEECISKDTESLPPNQLDKYRTFIQSTSYTRKLVPGSSLLYEVSDWEVK